MYDFITEDRAEAGMADPPSLQTYCDALGISASGYRKHCLRQVTVSQREIDHMMLDAVIRQIYAHHKGRYGYARFTAELKRRGIAVDRKRVLKRMQVMDLYARSHRKFKKTTCRDKRHIASPNLLQQQFHHIIQSMSSTGNCYDNAVAESYFKTIKSEEIYWKHYRTRDEARTSIADYIDYYNNERLHSSIGYNTPRECRELKSRNQLSITNHPIDTTLLKG
jgi:transposase InsO family protein